MGAASKGRLVLGERLRREMRRTFRRTTHFSKNEHPSFTSLSGPPSFRSEAGECRVSWRFTRFGSPSRGARRRCCSDSARKPAFLWTLHSVRFPPDRMNGAGLRRTRAPSIDESFRGSRPRARPFERARGRDAFRLSRVSSLELGHRLRHGHDHDETKRTRHRSSTSATDVKVEHTRERPVTPPAERASRRRWPSKATGGRAPVTRLGVELPLCQSLSPDQASARGREACSDGSGHPCRATERPEPGEAPTYPGAPRLASDLPRER